MTVCHVVGLNLQKSWSCCWSGSGGIVRKKIGCVVCFVFLLVILFENLIVFAILLVTDRKMIVRKQVLVVLLGLNSIDRNKKKAKYGEKSWS